MTTETTPRRRCVDRANWYLQRIDDLLGVLNDQVRPDDDTAQQCHSMLRELRARFRADLRPQPPGTVLPPLEQAYRHEITAAASSLNMPIGGRPTKRWCIELGECRGRIAAYLTALNGV